ncbi:hypothetical protein BDQ12DRAFT_165592 [Crucibulum laeve]|uniref:Uncharacterized protein n=1 Tax=Crucibulum laeve TaxID=68775 RepID=A0A5C3MDW9_9AGAR|nr:hypothetical protein BDQ12DRAFT_165592 [Crucibulum laeve]
MEGRTSMKSRRSLDIRCLKRQVSSDQASSMTSAPLGFLPTFPPGSPTWANISCLSMFPCRGTSSEVAYSSQASISRLCESRFNHPLTSARPIGPWRYPAVTAFRAWPASYGIVLFQAVRRVYQPSVPSPGLRPLSIRTPLFLPTQNVFLNYQI